MSRYTPSSSPSTSNPTRTRGLKRTYSSNRFTKLEMEDSICNSSDTEEPWTPPRKRFRLAKDEDSPTFKMFHPSSSPVTCSSPAASSSSGSPSKKRRRQLGGPNYDLTSLLRKCSKAPLDQEAILDMKAFPRAESEALASVKQVLHRVKLQVKARFDKAGKKILATELYLEWLQALSFVVTAIENLLGAKVPGTRKRVSGVGRLSFTILYHLIDEFISEVDSHHEGWSYRTPSFSARALSSLYPETMTIIEESHDDSVDMRTDLAVKEAEEFLTRYDAVFADAVRRYKIECGRNNTNLADAIGSKEHAFSKACCLLCEQTGYGSEDSDAGDTLLHEARTAMMEWKHEFGSDASDDVDNDELTSE